MVVEWVAFWPIFEAFAKETGYEGGGKLHESGGGMRMRSNNWRPHLKIFLAEVGGEVAAGILQAWWGKEVEKESVLVSDW